MQPVLALLVCLLLGARQGAGLEEEVGQDTGLGAGQSGLVELYRYTLGRGRGTQESSSHALDRRRRKVKKLRKLSKTEATKSELD